MGSGCRAPIIHSTRWRWRASLTPQPLYLWRRSPHCPLNKRLGGPYSWSGHFREEKNLLPPPGSGPCIIQSTAYSHQLHYLYLVPRWSYTSVHPLCLHGTHGGQHFTFYLHFTCTSKIIHDMQNLECYELYTTKNISVIPVHLYSSKLTLWCTFMLVKIIIST
jgi:hypothetical protein